jgi:hypothetical protein
MDKFYLSDESQYYCQNKEGQILCKQEAAVVYCSLPDLTAYESQQTVLLFFCICGDFFPKIW